MTNAITLQSNNALATSNPMQSALKLLLYSLSDASRRQYQHTLNMWGAFCKDNGLAYHDMTPTNLLTFLDGDTIAHSTKQARLTHIRRLLETLHAGDPANRDIETMYKQAKLIKIKRSEDDKAQGTKRHKNALDPKQVIKAFDVFPDASGLHIRNRALLAILFYAGLRRSEAAALKWENIDIEQGLLTVEHGKGDKRRVIPILGGLEYVEAWRKLCAGRTWVFCGLYKGGKFRSDSPMKAHQIYRVIQDVSEALHIDGLSPHDMRRTLLTNLINNGTPVNVAQGIAGHSNPQTTLGYAETKDAQALKTLAKLAY